MPRKKRGSGVFVDKFWLALILLFMVSSIVLIVGALSPESLTGSVTITGETIQVIAYARPGTPLTAEVKDVEGVVRLDFTVTEAVKDARVFVNAIPTTEKPFTGAIYNLFEITSPQADQLGPLTISLKLEEEKLRSLGLKSTDAVLYYESEPLETTLTKSERGYVLYKAVAPKVGQFVIGKATPPAEMPIEEPQAVEEALPLPEVPAEAEQPLVGKSAELPAAEEKEGFFARIWNFLKGIFS